MKLIIAIVFLATIACASAVPITLDSAWSEFKSFHGKDYASVSHEATRRSIWEKNLKYIQSHNLRADLGHHTYKLEMNVFGDMTTDEFTSQMNGYNKTRDMVKVPSGSLYMEPSNVQLPVEVDWRKHGYVNAVKNQGQCGSCWAFSTACSLEGQHFKKTGKLVSLSEQNLVDCSRKFGNMGCNGGLMDQGFAYIKANHGLDTEESYPYTAQDGTCKFQTANIGATDTGFVDVPAGNEQALASALATVGPISIAIDASHQSFQFYSSGVYNEPECSSTQLDHGVAAVGYGTLNGQDYFIVRNSWGASWGQEGYILMSRNNNNQCGVASQASYPLV
jgi:cathepsin L